jgi:twitching motility protein PilI
VVDLARFQGYGVTPIDANCRVIAFAAGLAFNSGLLVSQVLGLRNIADMQELESADAGVDESQTQVHKPWITKKYRDRDGGVWSALSLAALVQDQEFLHVGL